MISCTEYIPLYSDFFKLLDSIGGHAEVEKYWEYVAENNIGNKNNPRSLISHLEANDPFMGAHLYWNKSLAEERSDLLMITDEKKKYLYIHMRHCPSKGKLLGKKNIEPYYDYCGHCPAIYTDLLAKYGLVYETDLSHCDRAECKVLVYEKGKRPNDEDIAIGEGRIVKDMKAEDNEYYHPSFHVSCDVALRYCGLLFGDEAVEKFLTKHTRAYYASRIADAKERGIDAISDWLTEYYKLEHASERLHIEKADGALTVTVDSDPVIDFMRSVNYTPSKYHELRTTLVLGTVCADAGLDFEMEYYNENGGTRFFVREK